LAVHAPPFADLGTHAPALHQSPVTQSPSPEHDLPHSAPEQVVYGAHEDVVVAQLPLPSH
jgi:hypothetical protein